MHQLTMNHAFHDQHLILLGNLLKKKKSFWRLICQNLLARKLSRCLPYKFNVQLRQTTNEINQSRSTQPTKICLIYRFLFHAYIPSLYSAQAPGYIQRSISTEAIRAQMNFKLFFCFVINDCVIHITGKRVTFVTFINCHQGPNKTNQQL